MSDGSRKRPLLVVDSSCDLPADLLENSGAIGIPFPVIMDGVETLDDFGRTRSAASFYAGMRDGSVPTTSQIPLATYVDVFRECAKTGRPVLHLALSSGLSGTYETALMARSLVLEEAPGADIVVWDSLRASTALALLVLEALRRVDEGLGRDELLAWLEAARPRLAAYFTLESLESLRRGGRISDAAAAAGALLDVRPILRFDEGGHLVLADKVRGRRKSVRALIALLGNGAGKRGDGLVVIGHGDAREDAEALRWLVEEAAPGTEVVITETGPVIGAHTGPGMLSLVFWQ